MRRLRYSVAVSLDGFIAGPKGEYDWIVDEPGIDFGAFTAGIDTVIMGRISYEVVQREGEGLSMLGDARVLVVSTTLDQAEHPGVTIIDSDVEGRVAELKQEDGKDIWLFGGGVLFRTLLEAGLVDRVELGVMPVLLGQGIRVLPGLRGGPSELELHSVEPFPSGVMLTKYDVVQ